VRKRRSKAFVVRRIGFGAFVAGLVGLVGIAVSPLACAPDRVLVGAGGECFTATDCEPGLVCVPQRSGARACSADLSQVVGRPPPAGQQDAARDADEEGSTPEGGPGQDAAVDTGVDTGAAADTGTD
jgi:hypothetical protein